MNQSSGQDEMISASPPDAAIVSLQVGLPRTFASEESTESQGTWSTGFFKSCVEGPVWLGSLNIEGDGQADLVHHGGANKAICAYPADHYPYWSQELSCPSMEYGAFGENLTLRGLTENEVSIGDIWKVGKALIQVSQPRQPCWKLARRWNMKDLALKVQRTGWTGWYFRVLQEGFIAAGMRMSLIERPFSEWTIAKANRIMHWDKTDHEAAARLASIPPLSSSWKKSLINRMQHNIQSNEQRRLRGEE